MKGWINNIKKEKFKLTKLILVCLISLYYYAPIIKADSADDVINGTANAAGDVIDETVNILKNLTCETQGIGELLSSEFSHTCIPAPFSTFIAAGIVSPVLYPNMVLRLKINDIDLFGVPANYVNDGPNAQITSPCARQNRIEYNQQKITFGLCNNILLAEATAGAVANSAVAIASAALTGSDPWDGIKDSWSIDKSTYHIIYNDKVEGDNGIMFDVGLPVAFPWKIIVDKDRMCVATYGITGLIPVGCKYIKEPFPQSIYSSFMDAPGSGVLNLIDDNGLLSEATDPTTLVQCSSAGSCFNAAYDVAKSPIVISSPLIECIKQMTTKLLVSSDVCSFNDINQVINSPKRETSSLFQFQRNMHRAVTAFLSLYVIMWGLKIILLGNVPPKNEIINFALKIIFVVYFAVGINITPNSTNDYDRMDGMTQWAFPFLLGGISQISDWAMSASPSELCKFSPSEYPSGMSHMAIWDSLDCRVSHYLGLDILSTMMAESQARSHDFKNFDGLSFPIPPYLYLLIPAIITGQTTLISLALMFPLLIISVSAFMVNATIVCILGIVILGMLAPLFVPMVLFEYTKGYFDSWVKLLISFMLQPLIVATFIITMFSVYDFGFYGTCKYIYQPLNTEDQRVVKAYFIDNNWDNYPDSESVKGCQNSLGYMLNNPQSLQTGLTGGVGAGGVATGGNPIQNVANTATYYKNLLKDPVANMPVLQYISRFDFLSSLSNPTGMFFQYPSVEFEKVKDIVLSLVTACLVLYLMYNFSAQLTEFAADMTEGVSLSGMGITPQTIFKYGMQAAGAAGKAGAFTKGASKIAETGAKKVASEVSRGGMKSMAQSAASSAKDKISGGVINKAKDSFSVSSSSNKGNGGVNNDSSENDQNSDSKSQISTASNSSNKEINVKEQSAVSNIAQNNIKGKASNFLSKEDLDKKAQDKIANAKTSILLPASKTQKLAAKDSNITERKDSTIEDKLKNSSLANSKKKDGDDGAS